MRFWVGHLIAVFCTDMAMPKGKEEEEPGAAAPEEASAPSVGFEQYDVPADMLEPFVNGFYAQLQPLYFDLLMVSGRVSLHPYIL